MSEIRIDPSQFGDLALAALRCYPLARPSIRFLRHSENLTFEVTNQPGSEKYLLRLHYSKSQNFMIMDGGLRQKPEAIQSELIWLAALSQKSDLRVQRPVCNLNGDWVTMLDPGENLPRIPVSLLHWLDGEPLLNRKPFSPRLINRLGILSARLRECAGKWQPPKDFIRPIYAGEYLDHLRDFLEQGVALGAILPADFAVIQECLRFIDNQLKISGAGPTSWGLVHADFHPGNVLISGPEGAEVLSPIDFSMSGFSDFLFDVGPAMITLPRELRPDYLNGYRSIWQVEEPELRRAEGLALASFFGYCGYVVPIPAEHEWLKRRIPQVITNECKKLLSGEPFLFTM